MKKYNESPLNESVGNDQSTPMNIAMSINITPMNISIFPLFILSPSQYNDYNASEILNVESYVFDTNHTSHF